MRVIVGRIGRPHGIRGEVVIGVRTDEPDLRFAVGAVLDVSPTLDAPEGRPGVGGNGGTGSPPVSGGGLGGGVPPERTLKVASAHWHSGQLLVAFAGITDRTAAGELTGSWLSVDSGQLPEVAHPDEFRDHELVGLSVRTTTGDPVGVVTDVLHYGQDLLVVRRRPDKELLVPFVKAIVPEVDLATGVLVIDPPPGLLDARQAE
jgi:16S rRNA processing protein RimM